MGADIRGRRTRGYRSWNIFSSNFCKKIFFGKIFPKHFLETKFLFLIFIPLILKFWLYLFLSDVARFRSSRAEWVERRSSREIAPRVIFLLSLRSSPGSRRYLRRRDKGTCTNGKKHNCLQTDGHSTHFMRSSQRDDLKIGDNSRDGGNCEWVERVHTGGINGDTDSSCNGVITWCITLKYPKYQIYKSQLSNTKMCGNIAKSA